MKLDVRLTEHSLVAGTIMRFLAELPKSENVESWARTLAHFLDGLNMPRNQAAQPIDIAGGILAWERAANRSYSTAFIAGHVARCRESRLRAPATERRPAGVSADVADATTFWTICKRAGLLSAPSRQALCEAIGAEFGNDVGGASRFLAAFDHVKPYDLSAARTAHFAIERIAERLATLPPANGAAA